MLTEHSFPGHGPFASRLHVNFFTNSFQSGGTTVYLSCFFQDWSPWSWYNTSSHSLHSVPKIISFSIAWKLTPLSPNGDRLPQPSHCLLCCITNKVIVSVNLAVIWHQSAEINGVHTKIGRHANFLARYVTLLDQTCTIFHFPFSTKMEGKTLWLLNVLRHE